MRLEETLDKAEAFLTRHPYWFIFIAVAVFSISCLIFGRYW